MSSLLHDDPEFKGVMELLKKLELPFEIQTSTDGKGNITLGFSNNNIENSQGIPLEQSGNALQSVLGSLIDLLRNRNSTIK